MHLLNIALFCILALPLKLFCTELASEQVNHFLLQHPSMECIQLTQKDLRSLGMETIRYASSMFIEQRSTETWTWTSTENAGVALKEICCCCKYISSHVYWDVNRQIRTWKLVCTTTRNVFVCLQTGLSSVSSRFYICFPLLKLLSVERLWKPLNR